MPIAITNGGEVMQIAIALFPKASPRRHRPYQVFAGLQLQTGRVGYIADVRT
jgi:hypothetical protein